MKPYKTITLRLDAAHYARLTETARTAGLKIEPMLRQLIMGVNLRPRPPDTYAALLRELNAIGNNVNRALVREIANPTWQSESKTLILCVIH